MGSSQSKQSKQTHHANRQQPQAKLRKRNPQDNRQQQRPKQVKHKYQTLQPSDFNAFLCAPGFGRAQVMDEALLNAWRCTKCCICMGKITAKPGYYYAIHNTQGCEAAYHDRCMKSYLQERFFDRQGRQSRPRCIQCAGYMNIRIGKATRKNPIGFQQF